MLAVEVEICLAGWTYIKFWHFAYIVTNLYTALTELCFLNGCEVGHKLVSVNCVAVSLCRNKNDSGSSECSK